MELTHNRTVTLLGVLLVLAAISQPIYTALYIGAPDVERHFLWGVEGLLFVVMAALAGSALVTAKRFTLGFSAIAFSTVLNVVQVGVGLTQFRPFGAAAAANGDLSGLAVSVVAFSFFGYNAAKILLALAAIVFGLGKMGQGGRFMGGVTVLVGAVAFVANACVLMFGREGFMPSAVAGGSGVVATALLALCLFTVDSEK
ncbi:MAG: thiamine biosynthesis protein ThiC [Pseudomonadota bacterium]